MSTRLRLTLVSLFVASAAFAQTAPKAAPAPAPAPAKPAAAGKGPNKGTTKPARTAVSEVEANELVGRLVEWSRANKNAAGLAVAAQILEANPGKVEKREKQSEGGKDAAAKTAVVPSPQALRDEAKGLAGANKKLVAALETVNASADKSRGRLGGSVRHCDVVKAGATDIFRTSFAGERLAQVAVIGDGDTDLDLYVFDEFGNSIEMDEDSSDRALVEWVPAFDGPFTIKIKNRGDVYNSYCFITN